MAEATELFSNKRPPPREKVITVRLTMLEFDAVHAETGSERGAIAELVREGIGLALKARRKPAK